LPAVSAPIPAPHALRDDPLEAHLAGLGEHDRPFGRQGFAGQDAGDTGDQSRKRVSPLLERALTEILAV
jgi:hypothetical protein